LENIFDTFINKILFLKEFSGGDYVMVKVKEPTSKFVKIRCPKCKNEQIMFGKANKEVKCLVCGKVLAEPTGGKSKIKARILEELE